MKVIFKYYRAFREINAAERRDYLGDLEMITYVLFNAKASESAKAVRIYVYAETTYNSRLHP